MHCDPGQSPLDWTDPTNFLYLYGRNRVECPWRKTTRPDDWRHKYSCSPPLWGIQHCPEIYWISCHSPLSTWAPNPKMSLILPPPPIIAKLPPRPADFTPGNLSHPGFSSRVCPGILTECAFPQEGLRREQQAEQLLGSLGDVERRPPDLHHRRGSEQASRPSGSPSQPSPTAPLPDTPL